ncbi:MAG: hypothetical protein AB7O26_04660 [Planctomycetaceae bacterium]
MRHSTTGSTFLLLILVAGCADRTSESDDQGTMRTTSYVDRAKRAAYTGAPPVIPHPPLSGKCTTCHSRNGSTLPGFGFAPANPHTKTIGMGEGARCRQCHVFQQTEKLFAESTFEPHLRLAWTTSRAAAHAPPTIPHALFMREDCAACHTGPSARSEIRCSHPLRVRCQQCHVPAVETGKGLLATDRFTPATALPDADAVSSNSAGAE